MSAIDKVNRAKKLLEKILDKSIITLSINLKYYRIHLTLKDGVNLYIVYNNYDQYSYNVIFSNIEMDRCRFDNYDDQWDVSSKPHHFHPRYKNETETSQMKGDPDVDIPLLCKLLISGKLN